MEEKKLDDSNFIKKLNELSEIQETNLDKVYVLLCGKIYDTNSVSYWMKIKWYAIKRELNFWKNYFIV